MKIATAPVNWNNADAPDFREWFPYPEILDLMVAAGYTATEWGMNMPSHVSQMLTDLNERQLRLLGGFVALELRNEAKLTSEIERALELGRFFKSLGAQLLIAADSGDPFRLAQAGRVDPTSGLKKHEWHNLTSGLDQIGNQLRLEGVKVVFHNHVGTYVVRSVHTDLCFLGTCSIGLEFGVGAIEADELPIKQQMIESSAKVIALAAKEKFSAAAAFSVCPLNAVDTIITDQSLPQSLLDRYQAIQVATVAP